MYRLLNFKHYFTSKSIHNNLEINSTAVSGSLNNGLFFINLWSFFVFSIFLLALELITVIFMIPLTLFILKVIMSISAISVSWLLWEVYSVSFCVYLCTCYTTNLGRVNTLHARCNIAIFYNYNLIHLIVNVILYLLFLVLMYFFLTPTQVFCRPNTLSPVLKYPPAVEDRDSVMYHWCNDIINLYFDQMQKKFRIQLSILEDNDMSVYKEFLKTLYINDNTLIERHVAFAEKMNRVDWYYSRNVTQQEFADCLYAIWSDDMNSAVKEKLMKLRQVNFEKRLSSLVGDVMLERHVNMNRLRISSGDPCHLIQRHKAFQFYGVDPFFARRYPKELQLEYDNVKIVRTVASNKITNFFFKK